MALSSYKLDEVSYRVPPIWKIPFYEFIGGKLKLSEFEQELYKRPELESLLGDGIYIELVSFNFSNLHIYNDVVNFIFKKVLVEEDEFHCKLFVLIGKFYMCDIISKTIKSKNLPEAIVSIYEGAHIRSVDNPAYDVCFLPEVRYLKRSIWDYTKKLPSTAVIIGYAQQTNIRLLMDDDGIVYFDLEIVDKLYRAGGFLKALMILFFGLEYGELLYSSKG